MPLEPIADALWSLPGHVRIGLVRLPRRMTVARLDDGSLWLHSPNALTPELREQLDALGPVEHLVAPNLFHHLWLEDYQAAWPQAQLHAPPGLAAKRPDLRVDATLSGETPEAWSGTFQQRLLDGIPRFQEVAFLHQPSQTLLLTDACFHVGAEAPWATRILMRLNGAFGRLTPTRLLRLLTTDRDALRASVHALCDAWDFQRILVAHGEPCAGADASQRLRAAFA